MPEEIGRRTRRDLRCHYWIKLYNSRCGSTTVKLGDTTTADGHKVRPGVRDPSSRTNRTVNILRRHRRLDDSIIISTHKDTFRSCERVADVDAA